jgi:hypothetical protein
MSRRKTVINFGIALALCVVASSVRATTIVPLDAAALADQAELIFTGTAVHSEVVLSQDGTFPFTYITFRVDEALKGGVKNDELTLAVPGAEVEGQYYVVEGSPHFEMGERYLLFVRGNGTSRFPLVGWDQGQLRFEKAAEPGRSLLVDSQGRQVHGIQGGRFVRALPSKAEAADKAVLLESEGVVISDEPPAWDQQAVRAPKEAADAERALGSLRSFLKRRAGEKSFAPGRVIESARASEPPLGIGGKSTPDFQVR